MNKLKKRIKIRYRGITLVEMLIAIFIFTIILSATMSMAVSYLRGRAVLRKDQQDMEEVSLAINYLSKKIRMSNVDNCDIACSLYNMDSYDVNGDSNPDFSSFRTVVVKDNTSGRTIAYHFDEGSRQLMEIDISNGWAVTVIASDMDGTFLANGANPPLVTIGMWKTNRFQQTLIRTSVSQRAGYVQP